MSEDVEKAVESSPEQLKPGVDFAAFFAKHPLIPGGDEVLKGLFRERGEAPPGGDQEGDQ